MWPFNKARPAYKVAELEHVVLAASRDSAGFDFGALVRTVPVAEATVIFRVDSVLSMTEEEILAWEETIAEDTSVVSCVLTSTSAGCLMAVTVARESKDERKEADEIITRLAANLPKLYDVEDVVATPLTAREMETYIAESLNTPTPLWPELRVETITNTVTNFEVNGIAAATFDALDDGELDALLRNLVLTDEFAEVVRWTRVFRPALEMAEDELGRHSGVLTISAPTSVEKIELVVDTVLGELSALQRLRLRRMHSRQQTGYLAGLGIGVNAWAFDKVLTA
jgi:hypothetical protein